MSVDRPTFSESWYRVADLHPRLRSSVQASRQHFRGQRWYVLKDPTSNQFFRVNEAAYRFVALLDGRKPVSEVWRICNEQLGDSAPTQGEAIQLLGQLYTSNLLQADLPPDAEGLLTRYRKRVRREIQSFLMNLLFVKIPLYDPDRFLNRWVGLFGRCFSVFGLLLWMALVATGLYFLAGRWGDLGDRASAVLDPENLPLFYAAVVMVKVFHEFGHAFAVKWFGRLEGQGGEVHVMGVMFLVLMPLPYVDATSVWEFRRSKWHRAVVGAAGVLVELAIASVAAIVWANVSSGTTLYALCYNVMFIASVSTLIFNGNPLLRYDAYYVLSDLLEIPNLWQRSRDYLYYLAKRYVFRVRAGQLRSPAHGPGEKAWFVAYGALSVVYRVFISIRILFFIADKLFFLGIVLAVAAVVGWILVPLGRFAHYLATSGELSRVRARAIALTLLAFVGAGVGVGMFPAPDRYRLEGVVEPERMAIVHAEADGYVRQILPSGRAVAEGDWLIQAENIEEQKKLQKLLAEREVLQVQQVEAAEKPDAALAGITERQIQEKDKEIEALRANQAGLTVRSRQAGTWLSRDPERYRDVYVHRGDPVGMVVKMDRMIVRLFAEQEFPIYDAAPGQTVELRVKGRPDQQFTGTIEKILPAGQERLPSRALGFAGGGSIRTAVDDKEGTKAAERLFEIRVAPDGPPPVSLGVDQRVVARFSSSPKPLVVQWWRSLQQLVAKRFHI